MMAKENLAHMNFLEKKAKIIITVTIVVLA
jgi:hypothetical protein